MAKKGGSTPNKVRLTPGRPPSTDTGDARNAIMQAARRLLETKLPAQVTNALIAREAGVDPALIRYYFGDRSNLLLAVTGEMLTSLRQPAPATPMTAEAFFAWRVSRTLKFARGARSMQRLLIDELAESSSSAVREVVLNRNATAMAQYRDLLKNGVSEELVDCDPLFLYIAILGMCEFFTAAQSIVIPLADPGADPADLAERYSKFVADLLLNGLRKR